MYQRCRQEQFTVEAQAHLRRLAEYTVCYAIECHYKDSPDWWDDKGETYWLGHVAKLFDANFEKHLRCPRGDEMISGQVLQAAVNAYADHMRNVLSRAARQGHFDEEGVEFAEAFASGDDLETTAKLFAIMLGCPFMVGADLAPETAESA